MVVNTSEDLGCVLDSRFSDPGHTGTPARSFFFTLRAVLASLPLPMPLILVPALTLPMPYNLTPALPLPMPLKLAPLLSLPMPLNFAPTLLLPMPLNLTLALPLPMPLQLAPALPLPMHLPLPMEMDPVFTTFFWSARAFFIGKSHFWGVFCIFSLINQFFCQ